MIDLTPLDVRKKKGDFSRGMRGYEKLAVDQFLDLVAERMEELVRENMMLTERVERLSSQVEGQESRERAVQEALVTAQAMRDDIQEQAHREAVLIREEAEAEARRLREDFGGMIQEGRRELMELHRARHRFLQGFRTLLERSLDTLEAEEANPPRTDFELESIRMAGGSPEPDGSADPSADPFSRGEP